MRLNECEQERINSSRSKGQCVRKSGIHTGEIIDRMKLLTFECFDVNFKYYILESSFSCGRNVLISQNFSVATIYN